jgi:hypothetical protein
MDDNGQLMRAYEAALTVEREAWTRVQDNEGTVEGAADAWNAWLASADHVMKIGLQLSSRGGFPLVRD